MWKKITVAVALVLAGLLVGEAQINVPYTFTTSVPVAQLNSNLSTLGSNALNRTGGNLTGNLTADSGVTVDGVDISAVLGGTGTPTFSTLDTTSTATDSLDVAGGITAGTGNVAIVGTDGKIPGISSTYFTSLSGASLTSIPASTGLSVTTNSISYSAGNYTGGGSQTWGTDSGDVAIAAYIKIGTYMFINMYATSTDVGGTANPELRYTVPCTISGNWTGPAPYLDAATGGTGVWVANTGTTYISFYKDGTLATNWTLTTGDNTALRLFAIFNCTS